MKSFSLKFLPKRSLQRSLLLLSGLLALSGCEVSPYDVSPKYDSCDGLDVPTQLAKLRTLEAADPSRRAFKAAIISDSHENTSSLATLVTRINQRTDIDFVMILGDLTDNGLDIQYDYACKNLRKLNKPIIAVIGNHDSLSNGKQLWSKYFGPYNFSFSYLKTKFIAYNDNGFEFANVPDQAFIQREAALAPGETRDHTIAASHVQPISEVHDADFQKRFLKMLADANIPLTLHGHRHSFFYENDEFGNQHFVVAWTKDDAWAVMSVTPSHIKLENCIGDTCTEAVAK